MESVSPNVLELFKETPWKKGVDPAIGIKMMKSCLFKDDGSPNAIPPEELQKRFGQSMQKAFTQPSSATSGLAQYDLEQGARLLYPVTTEFRNMIPRVTRRTSISA
jgi:hypothetical protein